jgi:hypothetical protein
MAKLRPVVPALLVVAQFSRHAEALAWSRRRLESLYGPVRLAGDPYPFSHTSYYAPTMGAELLKQMLAFERLVAPDVLPDVKRATNALEAELAASGTYPEARPLNLDPGLLTLGKFLLATTKDQAHRVYLRDGIFAEVTLRYHAEAFEPWPWTYADYREPAYHEFLMKSRDFFRTQLDKVQAKK